MTEIGDYSGEYRPDLKLEEFSKEALISLWQATCRLLIGIDGHWYSQVKERIGEDEAYKINNQVWVDMVPREKRWITDMMKISGDDVAAFFKFQQVNPATAGIMEIDLELKNPNHGVMTVTKCSVLDSCEKLNLPKRQKACCDMDVIYFANQAKEINPNIKTTCLKLPPRAHKGEIACKWEFTLDPAQTKAGAEEPVKA